VQGHGTQPLTLAGMKDHLLEQLNKELLQIQMKVETHTKVTNPTESSADPFPEIDLSVTGQPPRLFKVVRRVPPSQSEWVADSRKADWWIRWVPLTGREAEWELYTNTAGSWDARRAHARANQGVDIVVQDTAAHPNRSGFFFPLWKPLTQGTGTTGTPFTNAQGKLTTPLPTSVDEPMASLANWYFPSDFHRGRTTVIRPKVS
jgi:hypothetical protein